jgi:hypothetical protein
MKKTETSLHEPNEQKTPFESGRQLCARVRESSTMLDPQTDEGHSQIRQASGIENCEAIC